MPFSGEGRLSEGIGVPLLYDYFFSYAHENFDADLERFSNDLRTRLAQLRGRPAHEVAFTDGGSLLPGVKWKPELAAALGNARVFIYVRSPQYFQRPFCGKEWSVFESRLPAAQDPNAARRLMVPLHWIPTTYAGVRLPTSLVEDTQYTFEKFGSTCSTICRKASRRRADPTSGASWTLRVARGCERERCAMEGCSVSRSRSPCSSRC